jgi:hypothetical protein
LDNSFSLSWHLVRQEFYFKITIHLTGFHLDTMRSGSGGILKLHEDVQTCGYKDVQVMFDMLTSELEAAAQAQKAPPSPPRKQALPPAWPGRSTIAAAQ